MKRYLCKYCFLILVLSHFFSCKKDDLKLENLDSQIENISIDGQVYPFIKDETRKSLTAVIAPGVDRSGLKTFFAPSQDVSILVDNKILLEGEKMIDYSYPLQLSIRSRMNGSVSNWTIRVKTESEVLGLGSVVSASKNLDTGYGYYFEQRGSGTYYAVNCGPAAATMAVKWADSAFSKQVADARNSIRPGGGWWYTSDISSYLKSNGINSSVIGIKSFNDNIKNCIDRGYLVVLCLDMYYVSYNADNTQQTGKFYLTQDKNWGHFLVVKGYKKVDGKMYFECFDPISSGLNYFLNNEPKGKNRFYLAEELQKASEVWWNHAIVVAPKGQKVNLSEEYISVSVQRGT